MPKSELKEKDRMEPLLSCLDTDDANYWSNRLNTVSQESCEALLSEMLTVWAGLRQKGIPTDVAEGRIREGESIYKARFGVEYTPF